MRYVIIGGSIAAYTAYREIKKYDPNSDAVVISKENMQPYGKMLLPYLISSSEVKNNMFYAIDNDDIILKNKVTSINIVNRIVKTESKNEFRYDKLLIATGADAYIPEYDGNYTKKSVFGVRYLDDMNKANSKINICRDKHAILIGAGLVTLETGWALVKRGFSVTYIVRSGRILSQILDRDSADMVEAYIERNYPVKFIKEADVESIEEKSEKIYVKLSTSETLEGCMVIVGKGVRPNIDFLDNTHIKIDNGVEVNGYLQTSNPDIYAVGDVALFEDVVDKKKKIHAIWPVAVEQAKVAAKNMVGMKNYYMSEFSRNALPVFDITIFTGGISNKNEFDVYKKQGLSDYRKIILRNGELVGFILIGDISNFGAYTYMAKRKVKADNKINDLLYGSLNINRI